jgi:gas vesicle protein
MEWKKRLQQKVCFRQVAFEGLPPVYIGFIGAVIGAIIGAFAAFLFAIKIENRREKSAREKEAEFRKRIASLVSQELEAYSAYLEKQLVIYKNAPSNEKKSYSITFLRDFNTLSRHYINMTPELKAKVFDIDTSRTLEKVYQFMQLLTAKIAELSQQAQPTKFEFEIEALRHDIGLGLKSIRNMKIV